jgi:hypothetical protein
MLQALNQKDVNRICSGQSVVDLATTVKEMVENALDAGATQIEIKLKEYGKESIEVSDNGSGITSENFATLALKHYTSKISRFEDIEQVNSFGFRSVVSSYTSSGLWFGYLCVTDSLFLQRRGLELHLSISNKLFCVHTNKR